jgi:hypothetical protein
MTTVTAQAAQNAVIVLRSAMMESKRMTFAPVHGEYARDLHEYLVSFGTTFEIDAEYVYDHYLPMMIWAGCSLSEMVAGLQNIAHHVCTFGTYPSTWRTH